MTRPPLIAGLRSGRGFPNGVGILRCQDECFLQEIDAIADLNRDRSARAHTPLGASDIARRSEGSDRSIGRNDDRLGNQTR